MGTLVDIVCGRRKYLTLLQLSPPRRYHVALVSSKVTSSLSKTACLRFMYCSVCWAAAFPLTTRETMVLKFMVNHRLSGPSWITHSEFFLLQWLGVHLAVVNRFSCKRCTPNSECRRQEDQNHAGWWVSPHRYNECPNNTSPLLLSILQSTNHGAPNEIG